MSEDLVFDHEARKYLASGIHKLAKHVIQNGENLDLELENQFENMGVSIGKQLASEMRYLCGDGTKMSLLLLSEMVSQVKTSPPIWSGMEKTVKALAALLQTMASPLHSSKEATDNKLIANALERVETIFIEKGDETSCEFVEGVEINKGYASAKFCTDREKMVCELTHPNVISFDEPVSSWHEIIPFLKRDQNLLLIASDFKGDSLPTLIINHLSKIVKVCAVKTPKIPPLPLSPEKAVIFKSKTILLTGKKVEKGGIARIRVPEKDVASTEKSYLLAKAALKEGMIDGNAYKLSLETIEKNLLLQKEEEVGKRIVLRACQAPIFSIETPLKVIKSALLLAYDAAHTVLSSECLIGIDGKRSI